MGYLKKDLSGDDKQELLALIEDYRNELVPLIVPLTLLQHHLRRHPVPPALAGRPGEWVAQKCQQVTSVCGRAEGADAKEL